MMNQEASSPGNRVRVRNILGLTLHALRAFIFASRHGYTISPTVLTRAVSFTETQAASDPSNRFPAYVLELARASGLIVDLGLLSDLRNGTLGSQLPDGSFGSITATAWAVKFLLHSTIVAVGGISLDPDVGALPLAEGPLETGGSSGPGAGMLAGLAAAAAAGAVALGGAA